MEVQYRRRRLTLEEKEQVVKDYNGENGKMEIDEILVKHHISKMTLYRILRQQVERGGEQINAI